MISILAFIYSLSHQPLIKCSTCLTGDLSYDFQASSYKSRAILWPGDLNISKQNRYNFYKELIFFKYLFFEFLLQLPVVRHSSCAKMHLCTWNSAFFAKSSSQTCVGFYQIFYQNILKNINFFLTIVAIRLAGSYGGTLPKATSLRFWWWNSRIISLISCIISINVEFDEHCESNS